MNNFMTIGTGHTMTTTDGTQYISSRDIAEWTEKRHDNLMRDIENYISVLSENEHSSDLSRECSSKLRNSITPRVEGYFIADTYQAAERFYVDTLAQAIAETTDMLEKSYLTHKLTKFMQEVAH